MAINAEEGLDRAALAQRLLQADTPLPGVRFAWTATIPRNAMGKVDRRTLRAEARQALGLPPEPVV